ncbi:MAG: PD-(D/E)XK nuclease family protein [Clostridia bacterium]|nr:PD-(D/E)XK nuclease family protein [Clostridia bacterium]
MRHYSHTRFSLFEACPRAYKLQYRDRVPAAASEAVLIGRVVHKIIAEYDRHLLARGLETDITALPEIAARVFYQEPSALGSAGFAEVMRIIEGFGGAHVFHPDVTVGIEEQIKFEVSPGVMYWGVLDLLEIDGDKATIVDYKTDWRVRTEAEVERDPQLAIYAWAVKREYPQVEEFEARLEFVRHGVVRHACIDERDVEQAESRVLGMIAQIEAEKEFAPRPGAACSWCGYAGVCPAVRNIGSGQVVCASAEDAKRIAGELALLERQVEDRKKALSAWCAANGPVESGGLVWGHWATPSKAVEDAKHFAELVEAMGEDPWQYLSVDGRKLKKLLAEEEKAAALAAALVDRSYTSFRAKKEGAEV